MEEWKVFFDYLLGRWDLPTSELERLAKEREMNRHNKLYYLSPSSVLSPSFWIKLTELKLNVDKLEETERPIWGFIHLLTHDKQPPFVEVDSTSFNKEFSCLEYIPYYGKIVNKNTIEQFKECNKLTFLQKEGAELYAKIISGEALDNPAILNCFVILSYADLKKYIFRYWFAFPVFRGIKIDRVKSHNISNVFTDDQISLIYNEYMKLDNIHKPFFLVDTRLSYRKRAISLRPIEDIKTLSWRMWRFIYFGFFNISLEEKKIASQLRNYVALIAYHCSYLKKTQQKFLALRCKRNSETSKVTVEQSTILTLTIPDIKEHHLKSCTGWERNFQLKVGPKTTNMRNLLDPLKLAENSVDLNLKLMKWRAVPELDLDKIKKTKCLLLGAGTLGCSVARSLLAWGVRYITFVDNATVSFSNPVRQSLFTYEDSVKMRCKAEAAAERLKQIFPGVTSEGIKLTIPMPGHTVGHALVPQVTETIQRLIQLIESADMIFLLMDSRESRWLPTMLGSYFGKTVINAALGFDSYLVMRHGYKNHEAEGPITSEMNGYKIIQGHNLGCYFCNDVRAPGDTMKNRTLDQQCTVTRPGVAHIASALAVELAVSILQHQEDRNAPAFYKMSNREIERDYEAENPGLLGLVPHSIRGFLSHYEQIIPATLKYDQCVACSDFILDEYRNQGMEFLFKVFSTSQHLEDVAKLTEMFCQLDSDDEFMFDDEDFDETSEETYCDTTFEGTSQENFDKASGETSRENFDKASGETSQENFDKAFQENFDKDSEETSQENFASGETSQANFGKGFQENFDKASEETSQENFDEASEVVSAEYYFYKDSEVYFYKDSEETSQENFDKASGENFQENFDRASGEYFYKDSEETSQENFDKASGENFQENIDRASGQYFYKDSEETSQENFDKASGENFQENFDRASEKKFDKAPEENFDRTSEEGSQEYNDKASR